MLYQSDEIVLAHTAQRRQDLLANAHAHRLARQAHAAKSQPAPLPGRADRLLAAAGALLVRWGTHLQQRSATRPATFADTRPA